MFLRILRILRFLCFTSIYLFIDLFIYNILVIYEKNKYFFFIPIILWIIIILVNKIFKVVISEKLNVYVTTLTVIILSITDYFNNIKKIYISNQYTILTFLIVVFFVCLCVLKKYDIDEKKDLYSDSPDLHNQDLFNLFYINTSKVHEIVMLIDNKIMKTVEREQVSEELLKSTASIAAQSGGLSGETSIQKEDNSKKRVYENFDVKTTKSIMLRKLYEVAKNNGVNKHLSEGQLILFKNVELKRRNIDDTVMILNVLQDSKLKNQGNDSIEINMNKMMEKMLDDFTIDYEFDQIIDDKKKELGGEKKKCLIQLPYKSNENFENGYQHNDLQLGKLSILGIYRGEIDFSQKETVSSKFINILYESYKNDTSSQENEIMKISSQKSKKNKFPFEFSPNRLDEKMNLIDVIAIIQELNINR